MALAVPDQALDAAVGAHHLEGGRQPSPLPHYQLLGHHCAQHHAQLDTHLGLLLAGERVDDAVDGVHRPFGVEGGDEQVAGLRRGHGGEDGLMVPHFPQKDHIGGLAQAGPQPGQVILSVDGDLPLADDAALVAVQVLDGVLHGDDMALPGTVDLVDDAGLGGGFAAARLAGDQDHAGALLRQSHHPLRDAHASPIRDAEGHHPDHRRHGAPLAVGVHPEAGQAGDRQGEIIIPYRHTLVHGAVGHAVQLPDQGLGIVRHQAVVLEGYDPAFLLYGYRAAGNNKQVRCVFLHRPLEICQDTFHSVIAPFVKF